jgi:hypothetical protein
MSDKISDKISDKKQSNKLAKVFGIGLNKTGTSSLGRFFEKCGYKMHEDYSCIKINMALDLQNNINMDKATLLLDITSKYDVFEDWPWPLVYKQCLDKYPDAKFILTVRKDPEEWFRSLYYHCKKLGPTRQIKLIYGHYTPNHETKKDFIEYYKRHNADVVKFFKDKPGKLLILSTDIDDKEKTELLVKFCNIDKKNIYYPNANKNKIERAEEDSYPIIYPDNICKLIFETQIYIESSYINYSKFDILDANIKKFIKQNIPKSELATNIEFARFIDISIKYAMQIGHRQVILYFMKTYEISEAIKSAVTQYAKNKDSKLLSYIQ